jgi:hypothetical protein
MITQFTIYNFATGEILRSGSCPESMLGIQVGEGESIMVGVRGDSEAHIVHDDGQGNKVLVTVPPLPPTEEEMRARYIDYAQRHMDAFSVTWGYDDIRSAVSYVGDPYPRFDAEGTALRNWRSEVWAYLDANQTLPDPLPTQAEFIALLPAPPTRPE